MYRIRHNAVTFSGFQKQKIIIYILYYIYNYNYIYNIIIVPFVFRNSQIADVTVLRRYGVSLSTRHNVFKKSLYRIKTRKQDTERALGKLEVSLGESGSFVRGKSGFPLGKVQRAKTGCKPGILGTRWRLRNCFTFCLIVTQKSRKYFALQKDVLCDLQTFITKKCIIKLILSYI